MCKASAAATQDVKDQQSFASTLRGQATTVFGADNKVFNDINAANDPIIKGGINQHGFNQDQLNDMNSSAVTNNANLYRRIAGATKAGSAGFGGGNTVSGAGNDVFSNKNMEVAQAAAAKTGTDLSQIKQADYATGRENFLAAENADIASTKSFDSAASMESGANVAGENADKAQANLDAQNGWWKAPVMGLISGAAGVMTGGLSSIASGALGSVLGKKSGGGGNGDFGGET